MTPDHTSSISRRRLLALAASLSAAIPVSIAVSGCASRPAGADTDGEAASALSEATSTPEPPVPPPPTPTPEPPFVVDAGDRRFALMQGTPYETSLYVFGSGRPGPVAMALGGVHGNEPGGWLAAERVVDKIRPDVGALLVVPRANRVATQLFERTTDVIGDLNRAYPGRDDGTPSERLAAQIVQAIRDYRVRLVVDMHESWAFYKDRPQNGTAFLGQTVGTNAGEPGTNLARGAVDSVNARILHPREEFFFRDRFGSNQAAAPGVQNSPSPAGASGAATTAGGVSRSSLGISQFLPSVISILVEMGQQQGLERRVALHVDMLRELLSRAGVLVG